VVTTLELQELQERHKSLQDSLQELQQQMESSSHDLEESQ
jgi:cell division protein ZapA (FtsZ GTPase activity inhibitor)